MEQFIKLYKSVYRDLYRFACYYMGNTQDAEDAVSEAVLKAYECFDQLRKPEAFRAWIFTILINQCKKCWLKERQGERWSWWKNPPIPLSCVIPQ